MPALEPFDQAEFSRAWRPVSQYRYLTYFGVDDAPCVVLAERPVAFDILTTGQRGFRRIELLGWG